MRVNHSIAKVVGRLSSVIERVWGIVIGLDSERFINVRDDTTFVIVVRNGLNEIMHYQDYQNKTRVNENIVDGFIKTVLEGIKTGALKSNPEASAVFGAITVEVEDTNDGRFSIQITEGNTKAFGSYDIDEIKADKKYGRMILKTIKEIEYDN